MKPKKEGQTLVEVVVATLIAAVTVMAVFSVLLSSFTSQKRADKREAAGFVLKQAQDTLKSYVSAVPGDANFSPNAGGTWLDGAWALSAGNHNITPLLNGTVLSEMPLAAPVPSFTYTVTDVDCLVLGLGTATACKTVRFTLIYQDE